MEHLTKQQIVLLTLFVSFVTSIATGIVAVSLMNQAPVGVTQTINRVVERTIEKVVSVNNATTSQNSNTAAVVNVQDTIAQTVEKVSESIVRLKSRSGNGENLGLGLILSKEGVIVTDKASIASSTTPSDIVAVFSDGKEFPVQVLQSQILGDIAFVAAIAPREYSFHPITDFRNTTSLKLGDAVLVLGGNSVATLDEGLVSKIAIRAEDMIETSISSKNILPGSLLITVDGDVLGIKTSSLLSEKSFYPLSIFKQNIPMISR